MSGGGDSPAFVSRRETRVPGTNIDSDSIPLFAEGGQVVPSRGIPGGGDNSERRRALTRKALVPGTRSSKRAREDHKGEEGKTESKASQARDFQGFSRASYVTQILRKRTW